MRRLIAWAGALLLLGSTAAMAEDVTRGGTFTFGAQSDVVFIDPVFTQQNPDIWVSLNLYDTLIHPSADDQSLEPGLASSFELAPDAKSVSLTLRPGIKFADGSPIELSDVKFSLERARVSGEFKFLLETIESVETSPPDKILIKLKEPSPAILSALATFNAGIVSEKLLAAAPGNTPEEKAQAFAEKPIGSGAFVVKSLVRGSEIVMERNPYYWQDGKDGKKLPYVDEVKYLIIPDDATRILKLQSGELDGIEFVPFSRVADLSADPKIDMRLIPAAQVIYLAMNNRPTLKDGSANPLSNKQVRQALNYAVDKEAIAQVLTYGVGKPSPTYMPPSTPYAMTDKGQPYPYNPDKAKALLKEAGFEKGFDLSILSLAGKSDDSTELAAVQQMFKAVGVNLSIQPMETTTRVAKFKAGEYQMRTALWTNDLNDPSQITSYFAYFPTVQSNFSGFRDMVLEELFLKSQSEVDPKKRAEQYRQIQEIYVEAAPLLFLLEVPYPVALRKGVKDFVQLPLGNYLFSGIHLEQQ